MKVWLPKIKSIAVLPADHRGRKRSLKILRSERDAILDDAGKVVLWKTRIVKKKEILKADRQRVAHLGQLYVGKGTIYSAIHFVWFTGCESIKFIGCDGINDKSLVRKLGDSHTGYDSRLPNLSTTKPWWDYAKIKKRQDELCEILGLKTEYLGTPL